MNQSTNSRSTPGEPPYAVCTGCGGQVGQRNFVTLMGKSLYHSVHPSLRNQAGAQGCDSSKGVTDGIPGVVYGAGVYSLAELSATMGANDNPIPPRAARGAIIALNDQGPGSHIEGGDLSDLEIGLEPLAGSKELFSS